MIRNVPPRKPRRGTVLLESGLIYSSFMMLILGTISIGLGIFRYQEMAWLAREGARWAAVHGPTYQSEQSQPAPTSATVMSNVITPKMLILTASDLTCNLTMTNGTATVTLTYSWVPEVYLSTITLTSTSVVPILY
jgi:Flp pilus assembly protein TadG